MFLSSIQLQGYRNYHQLHCVFSPGINLFTGANAQGKTNLIESIYYLSIGRAYRQAADEQLIQWGRDAFSIHGYTERKNRETADIEIIYRKEEKPAKRILVNGLHQTKKEEMSGVFISVLFSPESMTMMKGAPIERRNFLDYDIGQISMIYRTDLFRYRRLLAQRNALLKRMSAGSSKGAGDKEQLLVWDRQLIAYGKKIMEKRISFIEKMTPMVRLTHRKLTEGEENMELQYQVYAKNPATIHKKRGEERDIGSFLSDLRDSSLEEDLRFGSTQWGPHRDDVRIMINGVDARKYGSQGQQRTGILALKLAELEIFRGESGEYPVLLLDDVLSELDEKRQRKLLDIINEKYIQCIITATDVKNPGLTEKRQLKQFSVSKGEISESP